MRQKCCLHLTAFGSAMEWKLLRVLGRTIDDWADVRGGLYSQAHPAPPDDKHFSPYYMVVNRSQGRDPQRQAGTHLGWPHPQSHSGNSFCLNTTCKNPLFLWTVCSNPLSPWTVCSNPLFPWTVEAGCLRHSICLMVAFLSAQHCCGPIGMIALPTSSGAPTSDEGKMIINLQQDFKQSWQLSSTRHMMVCCTFRISS
jgi:hypothetical protein